MEDFSGEKVNKFEKNKKYYTVSIYAVITIVVSAILIKIFLNAGETIGVINKVIRVLMPYIIGVFIAYLMNPLVKRIDIIFYNMKIKRRGIRKCFSILLSYIIVFGVIVLCIVYIVPQLYESLKTIYQGTQTSYDKLIDFVNRQSQKHPEIDLTMVSSVLEKNSDNIVGIVKGSLNTLLPLLFNTSMSVISWVVDITIAIIVSVYMLIDRNRLITNFRKLIYAVMKRDKADKLLGTLSECNKIFGSFIIGKTIDSVIIGFMCFAFMTIIGLKYAILISVIVGITNMIPYFGPFIGAIPGVIILLTADFKQAVIFAVLILALQQFDGLYLGPKILGDSTGLRPLWIIFAITIGGWAAGPIGMFLGVPCVAVIAFLVQNKIDRKLSEKNIDESVYVLPEDYFIKPKEKENKT